VFDRGHRALRPTTLRWVLATQTATLLVAVGTLVLTSALRHRAERAFSRCRTPA
jgi:hypothetical protein